MAEYKAANNLNDLLIMNVIRRRGPISRNEIAKLTSLTHPTVTSITNKMIEAGLVIDYKIGESSGGRRPMLFKMNQDFIDMIIVHIHSNYMRGYLLNNEGTIKYASTASIRKLSHEDVLAQLFSVIRDCQGAARRHLSAISVIVRGPVNIREGLWAFSPNIGWRNMPLKKIVEDAFGIPVFVENDANAMTVGEYYYGAAKDANSLIFLKVGHGIGAGMVIHGRLFTGADNCAGEVGHTTIDIAGPLCSCGSYGCLEALASETALIRMMGKAIKEGEYSLVTDLVGGDLESLSAEEIYLAAKRGDELSIHILKQAARYLGIGIANIIKSFNPEQIILGGGIVRAEPFIAKMLDQTVRERLLETYSSRKIIFSDNSMAATQGAVDIVLSEIL